MRLWPKKPEPKKCQSCKWYVGNEYDGNCHKRSPIAISDEKHRIYPGSHTHLDVRNPYDGEIKAGWPAVQTEYLKDGFCGDFERRTA